MASGGRALAEAVADAAHRADQLARIGLAQLAAQPTDVLVDGAQIDRRIEALLYMFPLEPFGDPVVWWCGTDGVSFTIPPLKAELLKDNDTDASSLGAGSPID